MARRSEMFMKKEIEAKVRFYSEEDALRSAMGFAKDLLEDQIGKALAALHEQRHCAPLDPECVDWGVSFSPASITGSLDAHAAEIGVRLEVFLEAALALELTTATAMADLQQIDEVHQIKGGETSPSGTYLDEIGANRLPLKLREIEERERREESEPSF